MHLITDNISVTLNDQVILTSCSADNLIFLTGCAVVSKVFSSCRTLVVNHDVSSFTEKYSSFFGWKPSQAEVGVNTMMSC